MYINTLSGGVSLTLVKLFVKLYHLLFYTAIISPAMWFVNIITEQIKHYFSAKSATKSIDKKYII